MLRPYKTATKLILRYFWPVFFWILQEVNIIEENAKLTASVFPV